jgi:hypothetical protein
MIDDGSTELRANVEQNEGGAARLARIDQAQIPRELCDPSNIVLKSRQYKLETLSRFDNRDLKAI